MDDKKQLDLALRIWNTDAEYRARLENIRDVTRQRLPLDYTLNGRKYTVSPTPRGMAVIQMFASFPELLPRVMIPPVVTREREDEKATNIERFIRGIRRATRYGDIHPDDAFWLHYGESGRGILYTQFDVESAAQGEFPFVREAIDPLTFAFKASSRGLMYAVRSTVRDALELYDELAGVYEQVKDNAVEWAIPQNLRRAYDNYDSFPVNVMQLWTRDREYMWVGDECVWRFRDEPGRPHLMGRVPFDIGFCMQMPSERPEELGQGLISPILGNLKNESKMLDKAYLGFEFFFMPLVAMKENTGRVFFEQMVPGGQGYENVERYDITNPQVNAPMMEQLLTHNNDDINRTSLSETTFGDSGRALSGFAYSQVNSGPQRRNARLLDSGTETYKNHFNLILNRIAEYANEDAAQKFGVDDVEKYLSAFATYTPMRVNPTKELRMKVTLKSKDVQDYQIVELDFKPEPPEDANAKYQRAQLAKQVTMPQEYIDREVLKVESPEQVAQWRKDELLMQDPQWQARMLEMWKRKKLESDKSLAQEFQQQDIEQLPPELQEMVKQMLSQGATFGEAMDYIAQFMPQEEQAQEESEGMMPAEQEQMPMQGASPMEQPSQSGLPPEVEQFLMQLPPELQQMAMEMLQQGMSIDQVIANLNSPQLQMMAQQAQPQQGVGAGFVSPAQQGQTPVPPDQQSAMGGF